MSIEPVDLTELSRPGASTAIYLRDRYGKEVPWIKCGQIEINAPRDNGQRSLVNIRGLEGWTDFEHDSIRLASLELVGLHFGGLWGNLLVMGGYFDPTDPEDMRIPTPAYLAALTNGARRCKDCGRKNPHMMVDEGFYIPKPDPVLFEKIRSYRIEIRSQLGVIQSK